MEDVNQMTTCPNCGAEFAISEPRCPYCDALNPIGAEEAYMDALEDLREDTDQLDDNVRRDLKADLGRNARRTALVVAIVAVAIVAIAFAANAFDKRGEQTEIEEYHAREAFREQHFDELDRLYASGDDDSLSDYALSLVDDPGYSALYSWKHFAYLDAYDDWKLMTLGAEEIKEGHDSVDDYTWTISAAIRLAQLVEADRGLSGDLSQEEEARLASYRKDAMRYLEDTLQMSDDEIAAFANEATDAQGYSDRNKLKTLVERRLRELGTI